MAESRTLSYPVTLTTAQLSFLLALVRAERLFGVNNQRLFPEDVAHQALLWKTGELELKQDKWLTKEGQFNNPNAQLLSLVATTAAAEIIIVSQITTSGQPVQGVTHYVSNKLVVEVVYDDDLYQLTLLDSLEVMANRLAYTFGLSSIKQQDGIAFKVTQAQIQQIQSKLVDTAVIATPDLPERAIQFYMNIMQHLKCKGRVQFVCVEAKQEILHKQMGVLVGTDGKALIAVPHQQKTNYQSTDINNFQQILLEIVGKLRGKQ